MQNIVIDGQDFINAIILLKSTVAKGNRGNIKLKRIYLSFEQGKLWGYSCSGFSIMRTYICDAPDIADCEMTINVPRLMPKPYQKVRLDFNDEKVIISFDDITFKTKQYDEDEKPNKTIKELYSQLKDPYLDTLKMDSDSDKKVNKRINKVYLNPAYLYDIITALKRVKATKISLEVENINIRAVRITASNSGKIEAFLLPVRPSDMDF